MQSWYRLTDAWRCSLVMSKSNTLVSNRRLFELLLNGTVFYACGRSVIIIGLLFWFYSVYLHFFVFSVLISFSASVCYGPICLNVIWFDIICNTGVLGSYNLVEPGEQIDWWCWWWWRRWQGGQTTRRAGSRTTAVDAAQRGRRSQRHGALDHASFIQTNFTIRRRRRPFVPVARSSRLLHWPVRWQNWTADTLI